MGSDAQQLLSYDPRLRILKNRTDLEAVIQDAVAGKHPLFLCFRNRPQLKMEVPEMLEATDRDPRWQRLADVQGLEARFSYEVYRYAPDEIPRLQLKP